MAHEPWGDHGRLQILESVDMASIISPALTGPTPSGVPVKIGPRAQGDEAREVLIPPGHSIRCSDITLLAYFTFTSSQIAPRSR